MHKTYTQTKLLPLLQWVHQGESKLSFQRRHQHLQRCCCCCCLVACCLGLVVIWYSIAQLSCAQGSCYLKKTMLTAKAQVKHDIQVCFCLCYSTVAAAAAAAVAWQGSSSSFRVACSDIDYYSSFECTGTRAGVITNEKKIWVTQDQTARAFQPVRRPLAAAAHFQPGEDASARLSVCLFIWCNTTCS